MYSAIRTPVLRMTGLTPPRISILLPAHDAAETLPACLESIRRQEETRWECIVVDDGSTDGSPDHVDRMARRDGRFRLRRRPHAGLVAALEAGLDLCEAPYVARMDADDLMHGRRLRDQLELLEARPGWDALGCHVRLFPRSGLGPGSRAYERWLNGIDSPEAVRREAFVECPVAHPTLMIRRDVLSSLRYRDRGWPEDYDLVLRLLAAGRTIGILPRRRLAWRERPGRLSRHSAAYAPESFTRCKAAFLADGFLAGDEEYLLWGYGGTGRRLRRALLAHGKRPSRIIELHPGRLGNYIHGAPVVPPSELPHRPGPPLVVSVAGQEARRQIRERLTALGYRETTDYVCAA
jgi:glycosyltransferase involved in cell wall biosynthesis